MGNFTIVKRGVIMSSFSDISKGSIESQSKFFLNRYLSEFEGKFSEILEQPENFRKVAASDGDDANLSELDEVEFLAYLDQQGRTMTRDQMRKTFANIDFDQERRNFVPGVAVLSLRE